MPELVVTPGTYRTRDGRVAVVCGVCPKANAFQKPAVGFELSKDGKWFFCSWHASGRWSTCDVFGSDLVERISDSVSFDPPKRIRPWTPEELVERIRQVQGPLLVQTESGSEFIIRGPVWYGGQWMFRAVNNDSDEVNLNPTRVADDFMHVSDGSPCGVEEGVWS